MMGSHLALPIGIEPMTFVLTAQCVYQLSYRSIFSDDTIYLELAAHIMALILCLMIAFGYSVSYIIIYEYIFK